MAIRSLTGAALLVAMSALGTPAAAQHRLDQSFLFSVGAQGGTYSFETAAQTRSWLGSAGAHAMIQARRTGLLISIDQAWGDQEQAFLSDPTAVGGLREYRFDAIRRYSFLLTGYLTKTRLQPYLGVGAGIVQVVDPQPVGPFTNPDNRSAAQDAGRELGSSGFVSGLVGAQYQVKPVELFVQYQMVGAMASGDYQGYSGRLLVGPGHYVMAGLRVILGTAREYPTTR